MKNNFFDLRRLGCLLAFLLAATPVMDLAMQAPVGPLAINLGEAAVGESTHNPDAALVFEAAGFGSINGLTASQAQGLQQSLISIFNSAYSNTMAHNIYVSRTGGSSFQSLFNTYVNAAKAAQTAVSSLGQSSTPAQQQNAIALVSGNSASSAMGALASLMAATFVNIDKGFVANANTPSFTDPLTKMTLASSSSSDFTDYVANFFVSSFAALKAMLETAVTTNITPLTPSQLADLTAINNAISAINTAVDAINNDVANATNAINNPTTGYQATYGATLMADLKSGKAMAGDLADALTAINNVSQPLVGSSGSIQTQINTVTALQATISSDLQALANVLTADQSSTITTSHMTATDSYNAALKAAETAFPLDLPILTEANASQYSTSVPGAAVASLSSIGNPDDAASNLNTAVQNATDTINNDQTTGNTAIKTAATTTGDIVSALNNAIAAVNQDYKQIMTPGSAFMSALQVANLTLSAIGTNAALSAAISAANTAFPTPVITLTVASAANAPYAASAPGTAIAALNATFNSQSQNALPNATNALANAVTAAAKIINNDQTQGIARIQNSSGSGIAGALATAIAQVNTDYASIAAPGGAFMTALTAAQNLNASSANAALTNEINTAVAAFPVPATTLTAQTAVTAPYISSLPGQAIVALNLAANPPAGSGLTTADIIGIVIGSLAGLVALGGVLAWLKYRKANPVDTEENPAEDENPGDINQAAEQAGVPDTEAPVLEEITVQVVQEQGLSDTSSGESKLVPESVDALVETLQNPETTPAQQSQAIDAFKGANPEIEPFAIENAASSYRAETKYRVLSTDEVTIGRYSDFVTSIMTKNPGMSYEDAVDQADGYLDPYVGTNQSFGGGVPKLSDILEVAYNGQIFNGDNFKDVDGIGIVAETPDAVAISGKALATASPRGNEPWGDFMTELTANPQSATQAISQLTGSTYTPPDSEPIQIGSGNDAWAAKASAFENLANIESYQELSLYRQIAANAKAQGLTLEDLQDQIYTMNQELEDENNGLSDADRARLQAQIDAADEVLQNNPDDLPEE